MRLTPRFGSAIALLIGIGTLGFGIFSVVRTSVFVSRAIEAQGVVTTLSQRGDSSEWDLGFSFTAADGAVHAAQATFMSPATCPALKLGDEVAVLYDRTSPTDAAVRSFATLWFRAVFYLGIGALFLAGSFVMSFAARRLSTWSSANSDRGRG